MIPHFFRLFSRFWEGLSGSIYDDLDKHWKFMLHSHHIGPIFDADINDRDILSLLSCGLSRDDGGACILSDKRPDSRDLNFGSVRNCAEANGG